MTQCHFVLLNPSCPTIVDFRTTGKTVSNGDHEHDPWPADKPPPKPKAPRKKKPAKKDPLADPDAKVTAALVIATCIRSRTTLQGATDRQTERSEWSTSGRYRRSSRALVCRWAKTRCTPVSCASGTASHSHLISPVAERARLPSWRGHNRALATKASESQLTPILALRT